VHLVCVCVVWAVDGPHWSWCSCGVRGEAVFGVPLRPVRPVLPPTVESSVCLLPHILLHPPLSTFVFPPVVQIF